MGVFFVLSFSAAIFFLGMHAGHCAEILAGRESAPHSRPYMAAIMRRSDLICGGTLIRENWVLTAASCSINTGDRVILGAYSLSKPEKEKQEFQVINWIRHKNYTKKTKEHDIMLLQLKGKAKINTNVQTILLPTTGEDVRPGTRCLVVGWGKTHTRRPSDVLQEITAPIIDRNVCQNRYDTELVTTNKLCAGVLTKTGGSCNGDPGVPLICEREQRGINTFRNISNCNFRTGPYIYTRLTLAHIQWIKDNIQG